MLLSAHSRSPHSSVVTAGLPVIALGQIPCFTNENDPFARIVARVRYQVEDPALPPPLGMVQTPVTETPIPRSARLVQSQATGKAAARFVSIAASRFARHVGRASARTCSTRPRERPRRRHPGAVPTAQIPQSRSCRKLHAPAITTSSCTITYPRVPVPCPAPRGR